MCVCVSERERHFQDTGEIVSKARGVCVCDDTLKRALISFPEPVSGTKAITLAKAEKNELRHKQCSG